jgi:hypothetical protein
MIVVILRDAHFRTAFAMFAIIIIVIGGIDGTQRDGVMSAQLVKRLLLLLLLLMLMVQ